MIKIEDLSVAFGETEAVRHVNLDLVEGEILGVVGESGSGKSVTALTLMGLAADTARVTTGRILFDGVTLREAGSPCDKRLYRSYQGARMSMVFQEPMTSLNPTQRAGRQVEEMLRLHTGLAAAERREKVLEAFRAVGLREPEKVYASYPHQLSGGMRQRVMIAMAVILEPELIVADEPTTALDVTIQNQIIELLRKINETQKNAMLFITHDLNLARRLCHRVAVMKDGRVVEQGPVEEIFRNPKEEYTRRLIEAVPSRMERRKDIREVFQEPVKGDFRNTKEEYTKRKVAVSGAEERASQESAQSAAPVLEVRNLSVYYQDGNVSFLSGDRKNRQGERLSLRERLSGTKKEWVVSGADFEIYPGESLGLVGESGCGKTSLSKAILGMNCHIQGEIRHHSIRPQMIFQDPYSSLNPTKTIGWLLQEPLRAAGALDKSRAMTKGDMVAAAYDMLRKVGLEESYFSRRPSQLSGGQRQRVSIGQALITSPGFLVADEPVSALDVTIQAQIMELLQRLQQEMHLAYLFISHDINVVYRMCDRIMVMKEGRIIEIGETEEIFEHPREDYTKLLLRES
ncbi:dipeptide ABC transporter ATP-binding protein [Acetatifactor aquisgranensis]|uniref:dipeptide ABC transporter ATP-binding protein n=1 Tax=Acetatifactor aquisgranensis TaxID=2941233 RepID=UPI0020407770|nr:ABC transporter ATP-binding protein [Acetatifactor aquisgranensis]